MDGGRGKTHVGSPSPAFFIDVTLHPQTVRRLGNYFEALLDQDLESFTLSTQPVVKEGFTTQLYNVGSVQSGRLLFFFCWIDFKCISFPTVWSNVFFFDDFVEKAPHHFLYLVVTSFEIFSYDSSWKALA